MYMSIIAPTPARVVLYTRTVKCAMETYRSVWHCARWHFPPPPRICIARNDLTAEKGKKWTSSRGRLAREGKPQTPLEKIKWREKTLRKSPPLAVPQTRSYFRKKEFLSQIGGETFYASQKERVNLGHGKISRTPQTTTTMTGWGEIRAMISPLTNIAIVLRQTDCYREKKVLYKEPGARKENLGHVRSPFFLLFCMHLILSYVFVSNRFKILF